MKTQISPRPVTRLVTQLQTTKSSEETKAKPTTRVRSVLFAVLRIAAWVLPEIHGFASQY